MANTVSCFRRLPACRIVLALGFGCFTLAGVSADEVPNPDDPKLAARFEGRVIDPEGQPVRGARIYLSATDQEPTGERAVRAWTDAEGRFAFDASDMTTLDTDGLSARKAGILVAMAEGYGPDWHYVWNRRGSLFRSMDERAHQMRFELRLAKDDVPIKGRFLDAEGKPLVGAEVRLTQLLIPWERNLDAHLAREQKRGLLSCTSGSERSLSHISHLPPEVVTQAKTDAEGRFTLSGLGRDRLAVLSVTSPAVVDTFLEVMTRDSPDVRVRMGDQSVLDAHFPPQMIRGANFSVPLERGRSITGIVRDKDTQKPIPGMWVGIGREDFPRDGIWGHKAVTDELGRFTITGLDPSVDKWTIMAVSAPGLFYQSASANVAGEASAVIECQKGIPFRLALTDDKGQPVMDAEATYLEVLPNPHAPRGFCYPCSTPIGQAARDAEGTYRGFVLPGPGAILVKTPRQRDYRPAAVDPKAYFAPVELKGKGNDLIGNYQAPASDAFGTKDTIATSMGPLDQNEYAAIVLVNPPKDSGPLELAATMETAEPVLVSLVDSAGQPVVGATTEGITRHPYDFEPPLRAATLRLTNLHPNRARRITLFEENRKLIGFLLATGNGQMPVTIRMQPWGEVTGQILDADGKPLKAAFSMGGFAQETNTDPDVGVHNDVATDDDGKFRIDKLIPGQRYTARIYVSNGQLAGMAFQQLVLRPGERKDLGQIRLKPASVALIGSGSHIRLEGR